MWARRGASLGRIWSVFAHLGLCVIRLKLIQLVMQSDCGEGHFKNRVVSWYRGGEKGPWGEANRKVKMRCMPKGHTTMGALRACRFEGVMFLRGEEVIQALSSSFIHLSLRDLRGFDREVVSEVDREVMGLGM